MKKWKKVLKTTIHGTVLILGLWSGIFTAFGGGQNIRQNISEAVKNAEVKYVQRVSVKAQKYLEDYLSSEQVQAAVGTWEAGSDIVRGDFEFSYDGLGTVAASVTYHISGSNELALFYNCSEEKGMDITYDFVLGPNGRIKKADYAGRGTKVFDYRTVAYDGEISISKKEMDDVAEQVLTREEEQQKEDEKKLLYNKDGRRSLRCDKELSDNNPSEVSFRIYEKEASARELLSFTEVGAKDEFIWEDGYDYNFDGWYDLRLTGGATRYFLWNPSTRKYEGMEELEALENPVFDPIRQCIYVEESEPWTITRYSYKGNGLEAVRRVSCFKEGESWLMDCRAQSGGELKQLSKEAWNTEGDKKQEVFMGLAAYDFIYGMNHAKTIENLIEKNQILKVLFDTAMEPVLTFDYPYSITMELKPDSGLSKKYFGTELPGCCLTFYLEEDLTFENNYLLTCEGSDREPVLETLSALLRRTEKKQKAIPADDREYVAAMGDNLEPFRFYFTSLGERSDRAGLVYHRYWLSIYEGEKKDPVQTMLLETTAGLKPCFWDVNFDGTTDFYYDLYSTNAEIKGPGERVYYVWNKETRQFQPENYGLSDLGDLTFLPRQKLILEKRNSSPASGIHRAYQYGKMGLETVWTMEVESKGEGILKVLEITYEAGKQPKVCEYQFPETEWGNPGNTWYRKFMWPLYN